MKIKHFLIFFAYLTCAGCIEEMNFDQPAETPSQIVVYGKISNNPSPHHLRIVQTVVYGTADRREQPVEGATVFLEDDLGNREQYFETGSGNYQLEQQVVQGVPGRTYSLDILLPGGKRLRSLPETMPPVLPIDSLYWQMTPNRILQTFADVNIPNAPAEGGVWLRWETSQIWARVEAPIATIYSLPFYPSPKICFIRAPLSRQKLPLFESLESQGFKLKLQATGGKTVDQTFWVRSCMETVQLRMTRRAYQYWSDADKAANPTGTIFDSPPATVRGNLFNPDDPKEVVLGYFEAVAADTAHTCVSRQELPTLYLIDPCQQDFFRYTSEDFYFPPDCVDCLRLENSTLVKPWFW